MKKKSLIFYCITLMAFCQDFLRKCCLRGAVSKAKVVTFALLVLLLGQVSPVYAVEITEEQRAGVTKNCAEIKENLQAIQRSDAKVRVGLGRYYETIAAKFMTPLNLRLVENGLSNANFIENQNNFTAGRVAFVNDYITYQQGLEELAGMDCVREPEKFYDKLVTVRDLRAKVRRDTTKMRTLAKENVNLVKKLEGEL